MEQIARFAKRHGLVAGTHLLEPYSTAFLTEMERGLAGGESSLLMIPTYLHAAGLTAPQDVIVIDAGGTNLRSALVRLSPGAKPEIQYFQQYAMLGKERELEIDAFFDELAALLEPVAAASDLIGFCFSFPCKVLPSRDAEISCFNKEIMVKNAQGALLGEGLRTAMRRRGMPWEKSVVVVNDTAACQLGAMADSTAAQGARQYIGFVLGTGLNACYSEENRNILKEPVLCKEPGNTIINIEAGGFSGIPLGDIDKAFIAATKDPRLQHMEKLCSGAYQSGLFLAYLKAAAGEGLFFQGFAEGLASLGAVSGQEITLFCQDPKNGGPLAGLCGESQENIQALLELADLFFERVALAASAGLAAILRKIAASSKGEGQPVCISAEGSTFYKAWRLRGKMEDYLRAACKLSGVPARFAQVENATLAGAAYAGLLKNWQ